MKKRNFHIGFIILTIISVMIAYADHLYKETNKRNWIEEDRLCLIAYGINGHFERISEKLKSGSALEVWEEKLLVLINKKNVLTPLLLFL